MTSTTIIHLRSIAADQPAPDGWTLVSTSGGFATDYQLTAAEPRRLDLEGAAAHDLSHRPARSTRSRAGAFHGRTMCRGGSPRPEGPVVDNLQHAFAPSLPEAGEDEV